MTRKFADATLRMFAPPTDSFRAMIANVATSALFNIPTIPTYETSRIQVSGL